MEESPSAAHDAQGDGASEEGVCVSTVRVQAVLRTGPSGSPLRTRNVPGVVGDTRVRAVAKLTHWCGGNDEYEYNDGDVSHDRSTGSTSLRRTKTDGREKICWEQTSVGLCDARAVSNHRTSYSPRSF